MSLRDEVLGLRDARLEPVTGEGIPKGLFVGKLTVAQAEILGDLRSLPNPNARMFITFARDAAGEAPFNEGDLEAVEKLPAALVSAVNKAGLDFNKIDGGTVTEKNSDATAGEDSSSD